MAGVSSEQGGGNLNVELNLVPFIDLLSSLVLFLLVTAVWMQVSVISATVKSNGKSAAVQADSEKIEVRVVSSGYRISWPASLVRHGLSRQLGKDPAVLDALFKKAATFGRGTLPTVALSGDDEVPYESVVEALDAIKGAGVSSVGLSTD